MIQTEFLQISKVWISDTQQYKAGLNFSLSNEKVTGLIHQDSCEKFRGKFHQHQFYFIAVCLSQCHRFISELSYWTQPSVNSLPHECGTHFLPRVYLNHHFLYTGLVVSMSKLRLQGRGSISDESYQRQVKSVLIYKAHLQQPRLTKVLCRL